MTRDQEYRCIGKISKAHGLKGEFLLYPESDFPEWLTHRPEFFLEGQGEFRAYKVERCRVFKNRLLMKLAGIDNRTQVDSLGKCALYLTEEEATSVVADDPDFFFNSDLVGLTLIDAGSGLAYGQVCSVYEMPGQYLLEVKGEQGTFLFPFAQQLMEDVDIEGGSIRVHMPEGLIDCNRSEA